MQPPGAGLKDLAGDLGAWVRGGLRRVGDHARRQRTERLVAWLVQAASRPGATQDDRALAAWINDLGGDGQAALIAQVSGFLADFGLDPDWLLDEELERWPGLAARLRTLVRHYCLACRAAVDASDGAARFRRRRHWQRQRKVQVASELPDG